MTPFQHACPLVLLLTFFLSGFKWPTNLQELRLNSNNLNNNMLSSLSGLPRLQSLDLSYNQLEGTINISGQYFYVFFPLYYNISELRFYYSFSLNNCTNFILYFIFLKITHLQISL